MTSKIDQKSYLQKYLGGPSSDKKKKKKKVSKGRGFKIIDDDLDLTKLRPLDGDELDILDQGEDGPQIAGIIDERPEEVRKLEQFKTSSKWRVVNQDDGFSSKLQIEEIKKDIKEAQKENELVFGKMYSDSEDEKQNDSDLSPPRIKPNDKSNNREINKKRQNNSDSDFSPPRREKDSPPRKGNRNDDSDTSPPRKNVNSKGTKSRKPSRWADLDPTESEKRGRSKSSSPKRSKYRESSHKQRKSKSPDSDISPARKSRKDKYSPQSSRKEYNKRNRSSDIPQKRRKSPEQSYSKYKDRHSGSERNQQRGRENTKQQRNSDDSDLSPPRKNKRKDESFPKHTDSERNHHRGRENAKQQRNSDDSDLSPPRKNKRKSASPQRKPKNNHKDKGTIRRASSSDLSPPRKDRSRNYIRSDNSPPPTNRKMEKTLDGKMAGLQDARQLREENEAFRKREDDAFNKMTDEISGRNAKAVSRKASKRDTSEERKKQQEKAERQKELDEKYKKWSKGLKQIEAQEARMQDFVHEAAKPLARHKNDRDLENTLKDVLRDGDPMLRYIMDKKRERGELGPEKPMYKGNFPPNRFNIRPGYRWDGVDRSNGYEKKYFEQQSKRKAQEEEAYKWSTEDL